MVDLPLPDDPYAPLHTCIKCGEAKPWTEAYFRKKYTRKDGTVHCRTDCLVCEHARLNTLPAANKAHRPNPKPPLLRALSRADVPKPGKPSFRAILQEAVEPEWPKIAKRMAQEAGKGDKNMIKLVAAYVLGVPREASEDDGPSEFFHTLLAGARQLYGGPDAGLGAESPDLAPDSGPG